MVCQFFIIVRNKYKERKRIKAFNKKLLQTNILTKKKTRFFLV